MSDEVLRRIDDLERSILSKINDNKSALDLVETKVTGEVRRVEQKLDLHMVWETQEHETYQKRLEEVEHRTDSNRVSVAEHKIKLGLLSLLGGGSALGLGELIRHIFTSKPPQ